MTALSKLLVLIAIFLSASHANAFTSMSSVAGIKVRKSIGFNLKNQLMIQQMNQVANKLANQPNKWIWMQSFQEINLYPLPIKIVRE